MAGEIIQLDAPGLARLTAQLAAALRQDADLRATQGNNAQQAQYFAQPGVFNAVADPAITGNLVYAIKEAQGLSATFYSLVITFDTTSGSGRYRLDGAVPTPTVGVGIPAGGCVLTIVGMNNIKNFQMIAEAGQTLNFARYLFL